MNATLNYYNEHADAFTSSTQQVDMHPTQDRFLRKLPEQAVILDFGCGSGRDSKYFLDLGYRVTATDGSAELCRRASEFAGIPVKQMLFKELDEVEVYDGIWACSSILHLPKKELLPVVGKMKNALKSGGVVYTSFKMGDFEGERNGRFFTDFTEATFRAFLAGIDGLTIEEHWTTGDVRPGRGEEKWLNLILRKRG